jgi:hypothetical protein
LNIRLELAPSLVAQLLVLVPSGMREGPTVEWSGTVDKSGPLYIRVIPRQQTSGSFHIYLNWGNP